MIQPRNDCVLIERIEPLEAARTIFIPEIAQEQSILGKVLAVGPGKRIAVESRKVGVVWTPDENGIQQPSGGLWEEFYGGRTEMVYRPGDIVYFNSIWSEFSGSHYSQDQLWDRHLHLVMQNDIFLKVSDGPNPS